jgi:hypothetical protein
MRHMRVCASITWEIADVLYMQNTLFMWHSLNANVMNPRANILHTQLVYRLFGLIWWRRSLACFLVVSPWEFTLLHLLHLRRTLLFFSSLPRSARLCRFGLYIIKLHQCLFLSKCNFPPAFFRVVIATQPGLYFRAQRAWSATRVSKLNCDERLHSNSLGESKR